MDKLKTILLEYSLLLLLSFTLFVSNIPSKITLSIILVIYMILSIMLIKKREILSIYTLQVIYLLLIMAVLFLVIYYGLGLYFGYARASVKFGFWGILHYIIPFSIIIVSSEEIRYIFNSQKFKFSKIICFIIMVIVDLIICVETHNIANFKDFLVIIGFGLFASISNNLLYNYISVRYGIIPIILYRCITILYVYFIPIIPNIYTFFDSIIRMIYPYFIYLLLEKFYYQQEEIISYSKRKRKCIEITIVVIIATMFSMLISCRFTYGALVVGSGSMTGSLNIGDIVIYKTYKNDNIETGDILVFNLNDIQVIHRVVSIKHVNNETRYYTKGDANENMDYDYITNNDIKGIVRFKIMYLGYPTLWLKEMFS